MAGIYDSIDLYFSNAGDLALDNSNDIASTEGDMLLSFRQEIFNRVRSEFQDWTLHPWIGAGLSDIIGEPNSRETAEIGNNCVLFHGVTLGGTGHWQDKRHPTLGDNVLIGANATLLGPITIGENSKIGATSVIINRDVPANCTVVGAPGRIVKENGMHTNSLLPLAHYKHNDELGIEYNI